MLKLGDVKIDIGLTGTRKNLYDQYLNGVPET